MQLSSLPTRPLDADEVGSLNGADGIEMAVPVDGESPAAALLVATDSWVKALLFDDEDGDGWRVVESVSLADAERFEALTRCESAVHAARDAENDAPA